MYYLCKIMLDLVFDLMHPSSNVVCSWLCWILCLQNNIILLKSDKETEKKNLKIGN